MSSPSPPHPTTDSHDDRHSAALDWRQVVGGAGAASVVAYATSRVGLAGTIGGAAVMSVVAAITSTYLTRAARQTERQVRKVARLKSAAASAHAPTAAETRDTQPDVALPHPEPVDTPDTDDSRWPWRAVAIFAGVVFVVTIAVVYFVGIATSAEQPLAPRESAPQPASSSTEGNPQPTVTVTASEDDAPASTPTVTGTSTPTRTATSSPTAPGPAGTPSPTGGG